MAAIYDTSTLATRYKVSAGVVFNWIRERYLEAIKEDGAYTVTEESLLEFERELGPILRYEPCESECTDEDGTHYTSYGIRILEALSERTVTEITDVSVDKERVEELCRLATEGLLDPIHIYDVIEDFFYS